MLIKKAKKKVLTLDNKTVLLVLKVKAPIKAKTTCDKARKTTTKGNPPKKKPKAVPIDTITAALGDINILRKIATWLKKVKEAGSSINFNGETIGNIVPIAIKIATTVRFLVDDILAKIYYLQSFLDYKVCFCFFQVYC